MCTELVNEMYFSMHVTILLKYSNTCLFQNLPMQYESSNQNCNSFLWHSVKGVNLSPLIN